MSRRNVVGACAGVALALSGLAALGASAASAKPILLPTVTKNYQEQLARIHNESAGARDLQPPPAPCPLNGTLPSTPVTGPCGVTELPATGLPLLGNMAYYGGGVQVHPRVYVVYWGWGEKGAFPSTDKCTSEPITEGTIKATLKCDPQGAGKYTANWVYQLGDTQWAGEASQYYQTVKDAAGNPFNQYIDTTDPHWLKGIWVDDANSITGMEKTSSSNPAGPTNTYTDLAAEAARAVKHFEAARQLTPAELADTNIVVAQPPNYTDPNALSTGYCAFHDWVAPKFEGDIYDSKYTDGLQGFAYTNLPYLLAVNSSGINVCGEDAVNPAPQGNLDGFSVALGHEIIETITDPGAEDVSGSGTSATYLGGWYDSADADEIGDKCAWVGENPATDQEPVLPIPGAMGDIKGNGGQTFAVQSLWSNQAAEGAGYCAGAGTDLPQPVPGQ
jgi:hypothetical protein